MMVVGIMMKMQMMMVMAMMMMMMKMMNYAVDGGDGEYEFILCNPLIL